MSQERFLDFPFHGSRHLQVRQGDLTRQHVDAIVNAANKFLQHGGGVAGAISLAGGSVIQAESDAWLDQHGPISYTRPAYTSAGRLPCRYVIHAVGPVWGEGDEDIKLQQAIRGCFLLAEELQISSLAFPAISTGIFGFPCQRAAYIFKDEIFRYLEKNPATPLKLVRMVLFADCDFQTFKQIFTIQDQPA